jgi:hypothetical protein
MSNKESLRTFIYREAGSDNASRVALLKHLAPLMRLYNVDSDAGTELNCNDAAYEEVQQAKYSEAKLHSNGNLMPEILWQLSEKDMLVGYVVRSYNHSVQEGSAYPLLERVAVHLRQMLVDELDTVDFDGIVRRAYILEVHKAKWKAAADNWIKSINEDNSAGQGLNVSVETGSQSIVLEKPLESSAEKHRRRYQACIDAGLEMPNNDYAVLPNGINLLADKEGISKQAFSKSVKKHLSTLPK